MAGSVEHDYLAQELGRQMEALARARLFGITEAQRRTFDLACTTFRDFSRPLVSQILWRHEEGVDKDLRTLNHDAEASIKLYVVSDSVRARARIDEVISSYRDQPAIRRLLRGLRLIFVPPDFDADSPQQRDWIAQYLRDALTRDLLFAVLFGGLSPSEFSVFLAHHGPVGLKYAALHEVTANGLYHMPTFKERLGYSASGPIREALIMLSATGMVRNIGNTNCYIPTIRGRLVLDLTRALLDQAASSDSDWSDELRILMRSLGFSELPTCNVPIRITDEVMGNPIALNLYYASSGLQQFGRNLLTEQDSPKAFYGPYDWQKFAMPDGFPGADYSRWITEEDSLFFAGER